MERRTWLVLLPLLGCGRSNLDLPLSNGGGGAGGEPEATGGVGCPLVDADGDGHAATPCGGDCDDHDSDVFPGAPDVAFRDAPWTVETVDARGHSGLVPSIAIDVRGEPHVSYSSSPNWPNAPQQVRHARRDKGSWSMSAVATGEASPFFYTSIGLRHGAEPIIAYCSTTLEVASWSAGAFEHQWVAESTNGPLSHCELAFDGDGATLLAYHANNAIGFAYEDANGEFQAEMVGAQFFSGTWADIAVDGDGTPIIVYMSSGLRAARRIDGEWLDESVDPEATGYASIALDADGHPLVAYIAKINELRIGRRAAEGWVTESLVEPGPSLGYADVAIDGSNRVHLVYTIFDPLVTAQLRYLPPDGEGRVELPDPSLNSGMWPSLAVGPGGVVHIAYFHEGEDAAHDLRYARREEPDGKDQDCDGEDG